MPTSDWTLDPADGTLRAGGRSVLETAPGWSLAANGTGCGAFLCPPAAAPAPYVEHALKGMPGLLRFTSLHRFSPFWTRPAVGQAVADVQPETLWLLAHTAAGGFLMLVPLLHARTRFSLRSTAGALTLAAETGDPALPCEPGPALFVLAGDDPYALARNGARAVQQHLALGRLRVDKPLPDVIDLFGWCTWDAFYKDVSADGVLAGLAAFAQAGVRPRWVIVDDGWQQWLTAPGGEDRLTSLAPNARFGGDLAPLVRQAKADFGVLRVLVWHALLGYWGGLDDRHFHDLGVRSVPRSFGPGVLQQEPRWNHAPWGGQIGVPAADALPGFYDRWHASLAAQGVDGVKVDAQALLEGVSAGQGGRVALATAARRALERSTSRHFDGRLIHCMCCTQEGAYLAQDGNLLRSSDDFFPQRPASHGAHLHVNALAGLWFGEFLQTDWDMFQSAHPWAAFHAAARAISGGPVYVSDKVGVHDADLLRKLVISDGSVLRANGPARPSPDCLMADPTTEPVLLKLFNHNRHGAVVGAFHAGRQDWPIHGHVGPADVPGLTQTDTFIAWAHQRDRLWTCAGHGDALALTLQPGEWELVSLAPVERGLAVLGLACKFNSTGAIAAQRWTDASCEIDLRDGGRLLAWSDRAPLSVTCRGAVVAFSHDAATGRLEADIPTGGPCSVQLRWAAH